MVVLTIAPSSWIVIGSSTITSSGRRRVAPASYTVTSSDSLRRRAMVSKGIRGSAHPGCARAYGLGMEPRNNARILAAELVGTLVLMLGGPGLAVLLPTLGLLPAGDATVGGDLLKILIVALGFGFSYMVMSYVIVPISGGHMY